MRIKRVTLDFITNSNKRQALLLTNKGMVSQILHVKRAPTEETVDCRPITIKTISSALRTPFLKVVKRQQLCNILYQTPVNLHQIETLYKAELNMSRR